MTHAHSSRLSVASPRFQSAHRSPAAAVLALGALSTGLAWSLVFKAGVWPLDWHVTLLTVGISGTVFWAFKARQAAASLLSTKLMCFLTLLPAYVALQLIPLPVGALVILSPERARLAQQFAALVPGYLTAPLSVNPPATVLLLFSMLGYLATFLLVRVITRRFYANPWVVAVPLLIMGAFEALLGLFQALSGTRAGIASGTFTNRDHFSGFLEMLLPVASLYAVSMFRRRNTHSKQLLARPILGYGLITLTILLALAIAYSLSRMGFLVMLSIALIISILILRQTCESNALRCACFVLVSVALVAAVVCLSHGELLDRFISSTDGDGASVEIRLGLWKDTLHLIAAYPLFGCGLGGFESIFLKYQTVATNYAVPFAHNDYLQAIAELGTLGFTLLAGTVAAVTGPIFHNATKIGRSDHRLVLIACCGAWVAVLMHSSVDFNMYIPANAMTLAWITGIGSATVSA